MKFEQLIAKYITGNLTNSQLPQVAFVGIEEGYKSESLDILAGLEKSENHFVIEQYFDLAIKELRITRPHKRHAALVYAIGIIEEIFNGEKDLISGVSEIYHKAIKSFDFYSETKHYAYDSIGFERVYGLYVEYDDLTNELVQIAHENFREDLIKKCRRELFNEIIQWKQKLQTEYYC